MWKAEFLMMFLLPYAIAVALAVPAMVAMTLWHIAKAIAVSVRRRWRERTK